MMLGPLRAPSSPPETPAPMNTIPRSRSAASRRWVSRKNALPPSISTSPSSRWGATSSITASVAGPAWTIDMSTRGRASAPTHSCTVSRPLIGPSEPCSSTKRVMRLAVRLWTTTGMPWWATLRARFAPIVARPVRPKWVSLEDVLMGRTLLPRVSSMRLQSAPPQNSMSALLTRLLALVEHELPRAVELRHRLHAAPELAYEEHQTARAVSEALGLDAEPIARTGLLSTIGRGRRRVMVRAELDGLPIAEKTTVPYRSRNGAMHACAHDVHAAALVAFARTAAEIEADLPAQLAILFQPSEETFP